MTDLKTIPIEELLEEINRRRKSQVPNLVESINESLNLLMQYGYVIRNANGSDSYRLNKISYLPEEDEITYSDEYYDN